MDGREEKIVFLQGRKMKVFLLREGDDYLIKLRSAIVRLND